MQQRKYTRVRLFRRWLAGGVAALLLGTTAAASGVGNVPAEAATPGIDIAVLHNGVVIGDGAVVPEGDDILLRIQYNATEAIGGKVVTLSLPKTVTVLEGLAGNEAIESVVNNGDGTVTLTFKDPIPEGVTEGAYAIRLKTIQVDGNQESPISWTIGEDAGGVKFTVEDKVTPPVEVADGYAKSVNPNNLNGFVQNSGSPDYAFTGLKPEIGNQVITYTLVLSSAEARDGYVIQDTLAAGLGYVADSFVAELTADGATEPFTFAPTVTGNTFSGEANVPAGSTLRITYQVKVMDLPGLEALLKAEYDKRTGQPGNYTVNLPNKVEFGTDATKSVNVGLTGNIPGVGIGNQFAKSGNWTLRDVTAGEDGKLVPAADMTYTLTANLTPWDERNDNFTLKRNVVVSDKLIDQASWKTGADFLEVSGSGPIEALAEAAGFTGTAADFAADEFVGKYAVVGQILLVNVGKDKNTNATITAKAQLHTVFGLVPEGETSVIDGTHYPWRNQAEFFFNDGGSAKRDHNAGVVVLPDDTEEGINDSAAFNKTAKDSVVTVKPGETAEIPYRFTIDTSKGAIDPLKSEIVDEVNIDVFDVSDLSSIPVTGSYDGQTLTRDHFTLTLMDDNKLVIKLSDKGKDFVDSIAKGKKWVVDLTLTTIPFDGKQTFEVYNRAELNTEGSEWDYWSEEKSEATSYGNEAELRKRVYNAKAGEWTSELQTGIQEGAFIEPSFVYSIEVVPRGSYGKDFPVTIYSRDDILPEAVEFLGFVAVDADGKPLLDLLTPGRVDLNGNVEASYADGVVKINQKSGTSLNVNQGRVVVYFAAKGHDASSTIVNTIAGSETTITPVGDPSIDIEKWNDEGAAPEYDASGALLNDGFDGDFDETPGKALKADKTLPINFTVSNDGREELINVVVSDELTEGKGEIADLVCTFPDDSTGDEWAGPFAIGEQFECSGTLPALAGGDTHVDLSSVTGVGAFTGQSVDDEDPWSGYVPVPSIDIEKWNDEGAAPEYDESGALLNDGFDGDFDEARGKKLKAGTPLPINFTISNDGAEPLVDVAVSDKLTDGKGEIADLVCVFPDESTGDEWAGPFAIGEQFECSGTLPALEGGDTHADLSAVVGTGQFSGLGVEDEDPWSGYVPVPSIDIEKWNDEGAAPEYDESGALLNDGFDGDFDKAPGKKLKSDKETTIKFTISNDGVEPLIDVAVTDELTDGKGEIADLLCTFPDKSTGTKWAGPFAVGEQFECSGTLPALEAGQSHVDRAKVTGVGFESGTQVGDADDWHGFAEREAGVGGSDEKKPENGAKKDELSVTGADIGAITAAALLLLVTGGALLLVRRRATASK